MKQLKYISTLTTLCMSLFFMGCSSAPPPGGGYVTGSGNNNECTNEQKLMGECGDDDTVKVNTCSDGTIVPIDVSCAEELTCESGEVEVDGECVAESEEPTECEEGKAKRDSDGVCVKYWKYTRYLSHMTWELNSPDSYRTHVYDNIAYSEAKTDQIINNPDATETVLNKHKFIKAIIEGFYTRKQENDNFFVFRVEQPGTVKLSNYGFVDRDDDNKLKNVNNAVDVPGGVVDINSDWKVNRLIGYIYPKSEPKPEGTVALYRCGIFTGPKGNYTQPRVDFLASVKKAYHQNEGYTCEKIGYTLDLE